MKTQNLIWHNVQILIRTFKAIKKQKIAQKWLHKQKSSIYTDIGVDLKSMEKKQVFYLLEERVQTAKKIRCLCKGVHKSATIRVKRGLGDL